MTFAKAGHDTCRHLLPPLGGTKPVAAKAFGDVKQVARWGKHSFRDPVHCSLIIDDEVETPKTNGHSRDPNCATVIAGHPELEVLRRECAIPLPGMLIVDVSNLTLTSKLCVHVPGPGQCA
jgi:hypothetical protein